MAESKTAVYAAIGGNLAIAVTKFMGVCAGTVRGRGHFDDCKDGERDP
jgi:hypothetical protein